MRYLCARTTIVSATALALLLGAALPVAAQQPPLEHADVLQWKTIDDPSLAPDGEWLAFVLTPLEGDPTLTLKATTGDGPALTVRGTNPTFTSDSRYLAYAVPAPESEVDALKREGKEGGDLPKDALAVADIAAVLAGAEARLAGIRDLGPVESYRVAREGAWLAYVPVEEDTDSEESAEPAESAVSSSGELAAAEEPAPSAPPAPETEAGAEGAADDKNADDEKEDGSTLVLLNLSTGDETRYETVADYRFAEEAAVFAFTTSTADGSGDGAYVVPLDDVTRRSALEGEGHYEQLALSKDGAQVAFLTDRDDVDADQPDFTLYRAAAPAWQAAPLADSGTSGIPDDWWVSEHGNVRFSEEGGLLLFGTAPRPDPEPDDDTLDEDKVHLDVWNWKDPYLQPMQLVQADDERERTYAAAVRLDGGAVVQLGTIDVPTVRFAAERDAPQALGITDLPYRQLLSWDGRYNDLYGIDLATGRQHRIAEKVGAFARAAISPAGTHAAWWDGAERHWKVARLDPGGDNEPLTASAAVPHPVWNELDDRPQDPPPYGSVGWTADDGAFLFYDRFDVWRFEPETGRTVNLTGGAGRATETRFRYARTDPELDHIPEGEALWQAFHDTKKQGGFYRGRTDQEAPPTEIVMADKSFRLRGKAKKADRWLVTREDFREFPDLWVSDGAITDMQRMSDANPQQADYRWGSAELVEWTSNDGDELQGMLFTPDGFEPATQYPLLVYFYERMSDGVYTWRTPRPGGSSVAVPFYVSRGYVVFIPDIPYELGYPGESALDAVVPGVLSLIDQGFVARDRIGVQGHSWGGYQIAYMLTKTNLFAAAEAGAPVANMTSAYGGIRWQTGMSRMFQYERTQSRIGASLWEATDTYLHNSPLFYADKIRTPLLMMHNDDDGAVPWYQGIELFVALRRLEQPVWMLNYNGEGHGLSGDANRKDWAVRMQQFFDHYLQGAPAPVWMVKGVPAVDKGRTLGLELVEPDAR
ncbi:MAG: S9 family peptidase [Acidobacteria bacterium]|nr:S9 family peptidase [Acidobacteriota bacterium]